jgi:hypothetical protein
MGCREREREREIERERERERETFYYLIETHQSTYRSQFENHVV